LAGGARGAVIGAGVGAAAGAGTGAIIGRYMDQQAAELDRKVPSAKIERQGDEVVVVFNSAILFDTDSAELKAGAKQDLGELAGVLKQYDQTNLVVEGHTDSTGTEEHNQALSERRAHAVVDFLREHGVASARLDARGMSEDHPVASNATAEGRQQNRRVHIAIAPNAELRRQAAAADHDHRTAQRRTHDRANAERSDTHTVR
jgi:outer membrane protein OmpA-like peptidoglycan-associated protein